MASPIFVVDGATFWNVALLYHYFEPIGVATSLAAALVALQTGSLFLAAQDLAPPVRRWLLAGACILLCLTALANVAMGYLRGHASFPAATLGPAVGFGASPDGLAVAAAWATGTMLVAATLIYWTALSHYLHREIGRETDIARQLDEILKNRKQ